MKRWKERMGTPPLPGAVVEADGRKGACEVEETYSAAKHACVNVEVGNKWVKTVPEHRLACLEFHLENL